MTAETRAPLSNRLSAVSGTVASAIRGQRGPWAWVLALLVIYVGSQGVYVLATTAAAAVPDSLILSHLISDEQRGLLVDQDFPADGTGGTSDGFTECVSVTMGLGDSQDTNPFTSAISSSTLGPCSWAAPTLAGLGEGQQVSADRVIEYPRFWHGYTVITRPLLALGGIGMLKLVLGVLFIGSILMAALALARRVSRWAVVGLLLPILIASNLLVENYRGLSNVVEFIVAMVGVVVGVRLGREPLPAVIIGAAAMGSLLNFFDYLLAPSLAWAFFVFAVVAARWRHDLALRPRVGYLFATVGLAASGWIAGYALTWLARWVIAAVTVDPEIWGQVTDTIELRTAGEVGFMVIDHRLGGASLQMIKLWLASVPTGPYVAYILLLAIAGCALALVLRREWVRLAQAVAVALPSVLVPIWLEVLSSHSQVHSFFVNKSVPAALGVAAAAFLTVTLAALQYRRSTASGTVGAATPDSAAISD